MHISYRCVYHIQNTVQPYWINLLVKSATFDVCHSNKINMKIISVHMYVKSIILLWELNCHTQFIVNVKMFKSIKYILTSLYKTMLNKKKFIF